MEDARAAWHQDVQLWLLNSVLESKNSRWKFVQPHIIPLAERTYCVNQIELDVEMCGFEAIPLLLRAVNPRAPPPRAGCLRSSTWKASCLQVWATCCFELPGFPGTVEMLLGSASMTDFILWRSKQTTKAVGWCCRRRIRMCKNVEFKESCIQALWSLAKFRLWPAPDDSACALLQSKQTWPVPTTARSGQSEVSGEGTVALPSSRLEWWLASRVHMQLSEIQGLPLLCEDRHVGIRTAAAG